MIVDTLSADSSRPRVKCLLVDDLDENRLALSALLKRDDVELLQARSGLEALELLLVHDVALALLDVQMPEMDGFQLAELMRGMERTRDVPIIFVTAGTGDQQRLFKGYDSGAVDFLFKPIEPHILKSKAEVFFQLHRQKLQLARDVEERSRTLRLNEMFTAVLGHDLRGPLSAISMSAEALKRWPDDDGLHKIGERLSRSAQWMGRMIEDMLDLARTRVGHGIPLKRVAVDLGELLQRVIAEQQAGFAGRQIEFSQSGDLGGHWDEDRLTQVASNLVGNALCHGDPQAPVRVSLDGRDPGEVELCVVNGGLIPADVLPHIFDPFRSGRRQPDRHGGLGLGLYIVQQIVDAHQGLIEARSDLEHGTRFRVTLPRDGADRL